MCRAVTTWLSAWGKWRPQFATNPHKNEKNLKKKEFWGACRCPKLPGALVLWYHLTPPPLLTPLALCELRSTVAPLAHLVIRD